MSTVATTPLPERLTDLARLEPGLVPVVSVYLDTRWTDEHQRDRVRVFVKTQARAARGDRRARAEDVEWIEAQTARIVAQTLAAGAAGVALFAGGERGLREIVPSAVPFEDTWVVDATPFLGPLAAAAGVLPPAAVVFVDAESARIIPVPTGAGEEVVLQSEVTGHHRQGSWLLLLQSRYQRHIQAQQGRHYDAVAAALAQVAVGGAVARIVLAGEPRRVTELRQHLPPALDARVAGAIPASRHEAAGILAERAAALLVARGATDTAAAVDAVLTEAAKQGHAVAGPEATFAAAARGAVQRLYVLRGFRAGARACRACGYLAPEGASACPMCHAAVDEGEASAALVDMVVGKGGAVDVLTEHRALAEAGGVAARLRYPV